MKKLKNWKRSAVAATVVLFICAGVCLNWSYTQRESLPDLTQTLNAEQVMGETTLVLSDSYEIPVSDTADMEQNASDYFASVRLSRQKSRDEAVSALQEAMAYEDMEEGKSKCAATLDSIVNTALYEAEVESLVIAKGYEDCVTYISEDIVSVAVSSPEEGLAQQDVALISDIATSQTGRALKDIRIIEVK